MVLKKSDFEISWSDFMLGSTAFTQPGDWQSDAFTKPPLFRKNRLTGSGNLIFKGELGAAELGANTDANHTCTKFC